MNTKSQICAVCGKPIKPGDGAAIDGGKVIHLSCYEKKPRAS
jgi:hypothetical protein